MFDFKNKKVLVLGMGRSGLAAALLLNHKGAQVLVNDQGKPEILRRAIRQLKRENIPVKLGAHEFSLVEGMDCIVVSPGIRSELPMLEKARQENIPVISEIELAYQFNRAPLIAVTGSNGKSSTVTLLGEVFKTVGRSTCVGGNIGTALCAICEKLTPEDTLIAEISSFQLENIKNFCPWVSIILNVTPDHQDRYPDFESYYQAKLNIFRNQKAGQFLILNNDDPQLRKIKNVLPQTIRFSQEEPLQKGVFIQNGEVLSTLLGAKTKIMAVKDVYHSGIHPLTNILAVIAVALIAKIPPVKIRDSIKKFKGLEHRIEFVRTFREVRYFNDSKATNVDSVQFALSNFKEPVHLIAGGYDKGGDFNQLVSAIQQHVKDVILIGQAAKKMKACWQSLVPLHAAKDMKRAVQLARKLARPGETVLLSPACASFDMFNNFEERGKVYKEQVRAL